MKASYTAKNGNKIIITNFGRILMTKTGTGKTEMITTLFAASPEERVEHTDTKTWWARFVTGPFRRAKIGEDGERPSGMENYPDMLAYASSTENGYEAVRKLMLNAVELEMCALSGYQEHYRASI